MEYMKKEIYEGILKKFMSEYEIISVEELPDLIKVDILPAFKGWSTCSFIFCNNRIICFGDIKPFVWDTTWETAKEIKKGFCAASNIPYLTEKLEHRLQLLEFEFSDETMNKIKDDIITNYHLEGEDVEDFNKKWEENYILLHDVDRYRLGGLDAFFYAMKIDEAYGYYDWFYTLPDIYYCAVAMLRCIEEYFAEMKRNESQSRGFRFRGI